MLAYSYPLLGMFWSMLWFFLFIVWIWLLIIVFADIFRSHDLGGFAKALWVIFVIILPFLGVFIYLIARGGKMQEHADEQAKDQDQEASSLAFWAWNSASVSTPWFLRSLSLASWSAVPPPEEAFTSWM